MNAFESPRPEDLLSELNELATAALNENLSDEQATRLDQLVCEDEVFRKQYIRYMYVSWNLRAWAKFPPATAMEGQIEPLMPADIDEALLRQLEVSPSEPLRSSFPFVLGNFFHGTVRFFSQEVPFSLLIATVITGLGLLAGSLISVSYHEQMVGNTQQSKSLVAKSDMEFVGRITGVADVKWLDINTSTENGNGVLLGRRYALASGLMEITYDSGAKVILQGPCTYDVDSRDGGFLSIGKLTARLDNAKPQAANQKSEIINQKSSVSANRYPLLTIRTPTATVTDLGTEFGVEVAEDGTTTSHVFRGLVRVQMDVPGDDVTANSILLHKSQSAVVRRVPGGGDLQWKLDRMVADPKAFVRKMVRPPTQLDLLDIVAGGNGLGNCRERGIDAATGMEDPIFFGESRNKGSGYHRVTWHKLIDGVFTANGKDGPVVIDSSGNVFKDCPQTLGGTWGSIWARKPKIDPNDKRRDDDYRWVYTTTNDEQLSPHGAGLLCMHSNAGITFNLQAMSKMYYDMPPNRLRATLGMVDDSRFVKMRPNTRPPDSNRQLADVWILVDGQVKWHQRHLCPKNGTIEINLTLAAKDHFLTLIVTDAGNTRYADWVVFGDPVLELMPKEQD